MKRFALVAIGAALFFGASGIATGESDTMYVEDSIEITLRTGPGLDRKIIAMLKSDQAVQVLEPGENWTRVQLPNGKEGWVVSRYLTSKRPTRLALRELKEDYMALKARSEAMAKENKIQQEENERLRSELAASQKTLKELSQSYATLKAESGEFLDLKSKYETTAAKLSTQTEKAEKLEVELSELRLNHYIQWFLSGAGVLLAGFLIGFISKRQRRRSSLL
jgi:SH3 domain protein